MRHLSIDSLMTHIDGRVIAAEEPGVEEHLSNCGECAELRRELAGKVELFQSETAAIGKSRKIIAALVFDTYQEPALAGVRRVGAPPRQLLFRAGDVDVDVKIEAMEANDRITLVGQVLSNGAKFFDNTPVKLESHGIVRYRTRTNLVGEFSFDEVPKDTYHLSVDLPEGQITLFCVHRANA